MREQGRPGDGLARVSGRDRLRTLVRRGRGVTTRVWTSRSHGEFAIQRGWTADRAHDGACSRSPADSPAGSRSPTLCRAAARPVAAAERRRSDLPAALACRRLARLDPVLRGGWCQEIDWLVDRVDALQNAIASRTSEQMNRRIYTLISTIVLPLSLLAGVVGANLSIISGSILGASHPIWFVAFCLGLVLIGWGVFAFFRRIHYL